MPKTIEKTTIKSVSKTENLINKKNEKNKNKSMTSVLRDLISDRTIYEKARPVIIKAIIPIKKRIGFKISAEMKNDTSSKVKLGNIEMVKKPLINANKKMKSLMNIKIPPLSNM